MSVSKHNNQSLVSRDPGFSLFLSTQDDVKRSEWRSGLERSWEVSRVPGGRWQVGVSNLEFKLDQIGPKMGQIWEFLRSVSVHFGAPRQNVLKLILKSHWFVPFGAKLTQFGCQIWHLFNSSAWCENSHSVRFTENRKLEQLVWHMGIVPHV